jgi:hypothetical protein
MTTPANSTRLKKTLPTKFPTRHWRRRLPQARRTRGASPLFPVLVCLSVDWRWDWRDAACSHRLRSTPPLLEFLLGSFGRPPSAPGSRERRRSAFSAPRLRSLTQNPRHIASVRAGFGQGRGGLRAGTGIRYDILREIDRGAYGGSNQSVDKRPVEVRFGRRLKLECHASVITSDRPLPRHDMVNRRYFRVNAAFANP